jgi:3-oxoisoapionate decarboxylase
MTRREFAATVAVPMFRPEIRRANLGLLLYSYGIRAKVEKQQGFSEPAKFIAFAHSRGANAVQMPLGVLTAETITEVRRTADRLEMAIEGIVSPPNADADLARFDAELATAKAVGATVVRTVLLGGRRYETFTKAADYTAFATRSAATLRRLEPVARRHGVAVAVENHKDFRTDELLDLLGGVSSEFVGICVDTGNNLALLEDPLETVTALAKYVRTVHLKDMAVEVSPDGFRLAEVPLGQGLIDLKSTVAVLRNTNPRVRFHLEMITRDPLPIPCLTDTYWATLGRVPGRDLARTLARVNRNTRPLTQVTRQTGPEQVSTEDRQVQESMEFASRTLLPTL